MPKVTIKYQKNWLQILSINDAVAQIDNGVLLRVRKTGVTTIDIDQGAHTVKIWVPYLGTDAGVAEAKFSLSSDEAILLTYKMPLVVWMPGSIIRQSNRATSYTSAESSQGGEVFKVFMIFAGLLFLVTLFIPFLTFFIGALVYVGS